MRMSFSQTSKLLKKELNEICYCRNLMFFVTEFTVCLMSHLNCEREIVLDAVHADSNRDFAALYRTTL